MLRSWFLRFVVGYHSQNRLCGGSSGLLGSDKLIEHLGSGSVLDSSSSGSTEQFHAPTVGFHSLKRSLFRVFRLVQSPPPAIMSILRVGKPHQHDLSLNGSLDQPTLRHVVGGAGPAAWEIPRLFIHPFRSSRDRRHITMYYLRSLPPKIP